ncbi:MAG: PorT family protein [Bacteroidetes bacterium]|nr:PorT family protein [Bacteroidota bacterium]
MKKALLISIVSAIFLSSCICHNLGLKAGLNVATLNGDDTDNFDARTSMFFGGFAELCLTNDFAIQPELLYSMQGAKYTQVDGFDGTLKLDYLNLPIMAKIKIVDELYIQAGPQIGFLLSAKNEFSSVGNLGENDILENFKTIDFSANIGLGYQFISGLNFGARYNIGLSNINNLPSSSSLKNQNGVFQFSVGFRF